MPTNPIDPANIATEEIMSAMQEEISATYAEANAEMTEKLLNFLFTLDDLNDVREITKFFREQHKLKLEALKAGKISKKEYNKWKANAVMAEKSWLPLQKTLAEDLTKSRQIATSVINDKKCDIYALNYNYATYEIEKGIGASTSFALYDHDTVERLITKKPDLLPNYKVNDAKDAAWNIKHIRHEVTQGILQGESNQAIASRLKRVCQMSENASIRTARTATTCAQNSGRIDGYKRAQGMGIDVKQIWISTLDGRTRHEHRKLMGQKREIGKPFEVDGYEIMFPGDPTAKAFLVYNCRCTLIAGVDGANYDLENRIEQHLKEKDLTWDEWINEQPLPRHYGETKKEYLKRYKEHHQKMKFSDWMEDQVMPDSLITKNWADKKMSNIYNMIKEQNVTDANKFYKELGKLGKPSETWDKYLTGQLDAEDLKAFEEILKKYLPKETTPAAIKTVAVHQKAIEAEKQIKYTKSDPMSFDDADMHHVNPEYKGNSGIYSKNCQTCAMTYEARRQGYDVVALGKDPTHPHTFALQTEVGKDQAVAWINKTTGEMPVHLECSPKLQTPGKYKFLEETVGTNGERYTVSVAWKGGGAHVINMDRDANGVLRLIDNQRGPNEKHIWTGEKEIKQYLDSVKKIKYALRVDDCIPNPKYFNMITKEAKATPKPKVKHKESLWTNSNIDYSKLPDDPMKLNKKLFSNGKFSTTLSDISNKTGLSPSEVWEKYTKQELFTEDIKKLDEIIEKFDEYLIKSAEPAKNVLDKSQFANKKMSAVYTDIKKTDVKTANQFYKELQKMGKPSDVWDKYLKGELPEVDVQKIEKHLQKKYSALEEAMPGESVTGLDIDTLSKKKVTGVYNDFVADGDKTTANKFYNELKKIATTKGYKSQSDVWKKYLNGELDFDDIEKIDKYVIKKYQTTVSTPGIEPAVKIDYNKLPANDIAEVYAKLYTTFDVDVAKEYLETLIDISNKYSITQIEIWEKYVKQQLTKEEMKQLDDIVSKLNEYVVKDKTTGLTPVPDDLKNDLSKFLEEIEDIDPELAEDTWKFIDNKLTIKYNIDPDEIWKKYWNGEINDDVVKQKLDDLIKQAGFEPPKSKVAPIPSLSSIIDYDALYEKIYIDPYATGNLFAELSQINPALAVEFQKLGDNLLKKYNLTNPNMVLMDYVNKKLTKEEMEKFDKIFSNLSKYTKSTTTAPPKPAPATASASSGQKVVDLDQLKNKKVTEIYNEIKDDVTNKYSGGAFYNELKKIGKDTGIGKQGDVWKKYLAGELDPSDAAKIDKYVIKKYGKVEEPPKFDKSAYQGKKMSNVYNELKAENVTNANQFYNYLKSIGKPSKVWQDYLDDKLIKEQADEIEKYLEKMSSKQKATVSVEYIDDDIKNKTAMQAYSLVDKEYGQDVADEFYKLLTKNGGTIDKGWKKYLNGEFDDDLTKKIDSYLVKEQKTVSPTGSKLTPEQQKELDDAKKELEKAKKALKQTNTGEIFTGIWKDDVSIPDYLQKKNVIAAKKVYFEDELKKAKDLTNQNPHMPGTTQYDNYIKWNEGQIAKFEKALKDLDEFEQLGKEYEKAYKVVEKAQKKVDSLTPEAEAYSQERKDKAKWYTYSQYRSGDAYYTKWAKPIHATATSGEHSAYYAYTSASGAFNRPLAGFKSPKYSGGSGWDQQYFKGVGKVPLDNEGKGSQIRNLTTFIEKSKTKDDIWIQTAQNFATLEGKGGFLNVPYGALQSMTDAELQQFVGTENQLGQFVSGSINRGGGSYTPGSMRINIYCPKGSEALYVLSDGAFGKSEHEIILQRGGTYKITKIYWGRDAESGGRKLMVDMELRLEKGYNKYDQ